MKTKISNIGAIATWSPARDQLDILTGVEVLIENGIITSIAPEVTGAEEEVNADGSMLTPGFVDPHTHPVFYGNRATEFNMRVGGSSYEDISRAGGGIISSITGVRNASEDQLIDETLERLHDFIFHGTTTIEAKSGYGLDLESELKSLRVLKKLKAESPLDIISTFLGAHSFPPEFKDNRPGYIDLLCNEMIPAVAEEELAEFCDVFCEKGYFSVDDSRRILETARKFGMKIRLHADEFIDSGAAELAAEMGACSADHLMSVSEVGIKAMAKAGVIATLLPGTTLFLGKKEYAPGGKLIAAGVEVALATDFNPGSCTLNSMPMVMSLANLYCGLSIEQSFKAATWNAAKSLQREHTIGAIGEGYQADILFWDIRDLSEISYWLGSDHILSVMKKGDLIEH